MKTVYFLMFMGWSQGGYLSTSGTAVMPTPYPTLEACETAARNTYRADKKEPASRYIWSFCVPSETSK